MDRYSLKINIICFQKTIIIIYYLSFTMAGAAQQGAALQTYNNELVKCLEELNYRRNCLDKEIAVDEQEKTVLENQVKEFQAKLNKVEARLRNKYETRDQYVKTIQESENAYKKILETSQVLLSSVKRESAVLMGGNYHDTTMNNHNLSSPPVSSSSNHIHHQHHQNNNPPQQQPLHNHHRYNQGK